MVLELCVVTVLFDPTVARGRNVVVTLCAMRAAVARETVVRVCVQLVLAIVTVCVVMTRGRWSVDCHSEAELQRNVVLLVCEFGVRVGRRIKPCAVCGPDRVVQNGFVDRSCVLDQLFVEGMVYEFGERGLRVLGGSRCPVRPRGCWVVLR